MASFDTKATKVLKTSDKAIQVALLDKDGKAQTPWFPRKYCEFKLPEGRRTPTLHVQTWFAKKVKIA